MVNMAAELGKRLLAEVEEVGLDEVGHMPLPNTIGLSEVTPSQILQTVRLRHDPEPLHFGIPNVDKIVNTAISVKANPPSTPPILELLSQAPGSGTTHFLYLLIATAILPSSYGGQNSCVAVLDTDNTFSVSRLVTQLRLSLPPDSAPSSITTALSHLHIFRPQSLPTLIATLENLPTYFLSTPHPSLHRPLAFIALDSLTAFHWQSKAADEDRAFANQHPSSSPTPGSPGLPSAKPAKDLPTLLKNTAASLSASVVFTSHFLTTYNQSHNNTNTPRSPLTPTVRFSLHRRPVRSFPPTISISEARREAGDRQRAVDAAGWEVSVLESGAEQRVLRGMGFGFKITNEGVTVEVEAEN